MELLGVVGAVCLLPEWPADCGEDPADLRKRRKYRSPRRRSTGSCPIAICLDVAWGRSSFRPTLRQDQLRHRCQPLLSPQLCPILQTCFVPLLTRHPPARHWPAGRVARVWDDHPGSASQLRSLMSTTGQQGTLQNSLVRGGGARHYEHRRRHAVGETRWVLHRYVRTITSTIV